MSKVLETAKVFEFMQNQLSVELSPYDNLHLLLLFTFQPPMTGFYVFSLACASACELWLGGDDVEANITRMAKLEPWQSTEYQQWEKYYLLYVGANYIILEILFV